MKLSSEIARKKKQKYFLYPVCKLIKNRSEITEVEMTQCTRARKQDLIRERHTSAKTYRF